MVEAARFAKLCCMPVDSEQLAALRQEYSLTPLRRANLDPDPIVQFQKWFADALTHQVPEPNAMTLATVDSENRPWTRTVLLKGCEERGFTFYTNYDGAKGRQLAANPHASLTFWWAALQRQVNITGTVMKTSREDSECYFITRPVNSRLGAWASRQSEVIADRGQLERQFAEARERFGEVDIPLPPNWGGYCLKPDTIEFWQGQQSRLHDRLRYVRGGDGGWVVERFSP